MPRQSAIRIDEVTGAGAGEEPAALARDAAESDGNALGLPWLFPWLLALSGILITLALMR